jgi:hypothetical protein
MRRLSDMGRPFSFSSGLVNWELDSSGDRLVVLDIIRIGFGVDATVALCFLFRWKEK